MSEENKKETAAEAGKEKKEKAAGKKIDVKRTAEKVGKIAASAADSAGKIAGAAAGKTKEAAEKALQEIVKAVDQNGNGQIDIEDVIMLAMKVPGVRINREAFLRKELQTKIPQETVDDAVTFNPLHAKIPSDLIDKIADEVIKNERFGVSGISALLSVPGGWTMVATIPADLAQYYGYMLRAAQKLMYLYGFPEIDTEENEATFDSATMNTLIICLGIMFGVSGANKALNVMAKALASGVEKKIMQTALTKGTLYPIIKKIARWFSVKMTKKILAEAAKKAIPVVGGVVGGGITFLAFKPCCDRLKAVLKDTILSNPDYQPSPDDDGEISADAQTGDGEMVVDAQMVDGEIVVDVQTDGAETEDKA